MSSISENTVLTEVEYILASGTGTLDFAIEGEEGYYTWRGSEEADWEVKDVESVQNVEEDRFMIYPEDDYFVCEIEAGSEENNLGPVRCYCA